MNDAYAVNKLAAHPEVLADLRAGGGGRLISVHLMLANQCASRCAFCSYRMPDNKNSLDFDETKQIPWAVMPQLLDDFQTLGVQGIEVTGGGEPLQYKWRTEFWEEVARRPFDMALVTSGIALGSAAPLICSSRLKWVRVSIDCATANTYEVMRRVPAVNFERAWRAVRQFREHAPNDPEFRLGVGFVLSNENWREVYDFVRMAKDYGADNVRLSSTFSDKHLAYFWPSVDLKAAAEESIMAKDHFEDDSFKVHNLIPSRLWETEHPTQDYERCTTKDVLCVVEGECKVYTCCTFTGSKKGLYGKFTDHPRGFRGLWEDNAAWRKNFNAKKYCTVSCLYRDRNLAMIDLIAAPTMPTQQEQPHKSFI